MSMTTTFTEQILAILDEHENDDSPMWRAYERMYATQTLEERREFSRRIWQDFAADSLPGDIFIASNEAHDELVGMVTAVFLAGLAIGREHASKGLPTP